MRHRPLSYPSLVDTAREGSLSFAPPGAGGDLLRGSGRPPIAVGPGRAVLTSGSGLLRDDVKGYPIQLAKVQRPPLRDETLERPRLLDWLRAKVHHRVVLLLADAGYGKTTLLADFSRRSRVRTLWYRLDHEDRDWVAFIHHLVAAGREHDPSFAPVTAGLLAETGVGGPGREMVLDALIRELPSIATEGAVLIFDDFHLVDDAVDVRHIARELLARAPERLTIAFASRRPPTVPLARLRAVGEVAELSTDDLRFDAAETTQLFTETYGRHLEPDVLADLAVRTEGWIASLQLVQAALRDRSPVEIRRFVRSLRGSDHEMYDYLAEEVVGDLELELQRFLMETSILQVVTPEFAEIVTGLGPSDVTRLTAAAERLTLLSRLSGGPRTHQRYHPLVREFLEARFRSMDGVDAVADLHRRTAAAAAATDWRIAAHHYREAGDTDDVLGVVADAIPTIMGNGQYALAESFIGQIPPGERPAGFDLILSRVDMQHGDYEAAIAASQAVLDSPATDEIQRDHALLNLLTLYFNVGDGERALTFAHSLSASADSNLRAIGEVTAAIVTCETERDIDAVCHRLRAMAKAQRSGKSHHFAVSMFNLATISIVLDRLDDARRELDAALEAWDPSTASLERVAALASKAMVELRVGNTEAAEAIGSEIVGQPEFVQTDVFLELADAFDSFGAEETAMVLFDRVRDRTGSGLLDRRLLSIAKGRSLIRQRRFTDAEEVLNTFPPGLQTLVGLQLAHRVAEAHLAVARRDPSAQELIAEVARQAQVTGIAGMRRVIDLIEAITLGPVELSRAVLGIGRSAPWHLTFLADLIVPLLEELSEEARKVILAEGRIHPERWRRDLRLTVRESSGSATAAASLLEEIGEKADIALLRRFAKASKRRRDSAGVGRRLARRLADRVTIEDQGRVVLRVGSREFPGSTIRRKVLALLCFLITRQGLSATRDQVLDALWPDLDPDVAVNSLNQTMYFLRRVFEEDYSDDLTPGYIHHDSDVIWLDSELIQSRSDACRMLIRELSTPATGDEVLRLVDSYRGRFALDFEYEEWAGAYRDSLHAAYLEVVERSVADDLSTGHHDRGIYVARRALEVDPGAEQVEVSLLRLYRATGAHAAAAEQYAHYAAVMRDDLGIEPPPLDAL